MDHLRLTRHAEMRMRQRSFRNDDFWWALSVATCMADNVFLVRDKDIAWETEASPREIQQLERLRGTVWVVVDGKVITAYRSNRKPSRAGGRKRWRPAKDRRGRCSWRRA